MSDFNPSPGTLLTIGGVDYRVAQHPNALNVAHAQIGRQGTVYELRGPNATFALKVFKRTYQDPSLVGRSDGLRRYADTITGLRVLGRTVLSEDYVDNDQLSAHPELWYAVLMPWIEGETWKAVVAERWELSAEDSRRLARSLASVLRRMGEHGLGHGDLSGDNLLLPGLVVRDSIAHAGDVQSVQLVDVEQLYAPEVSSARPRAPLVAGSPGYQRALGQLASDAGIAWDSDVDRFSGAVLLAEILGWCDREVRAASHDDAYFKTCDALDWQRASILTTALQRHWGDTLADLFQQVWASTHVSECPEFLDWYLAIDRAVPTELPRPVRATRSMAPGPDREPSAPSHPSESADSVSVRELPPAESEPPGPRADRSSLVPHADGLAPAPADTTSGATATPEPSPSAPLRTTPAPHSNGLPQLPPMVESEPGASSDAEPLELAPARPPLAPPPTVATSATTPEARSAGAPGIASESQPPPWVAGDTPAPSADAYVRGPGIVNQLQRAFGVGSASRPRRWVSLGVASLLLAGVAVLVARNPNDQGAQALQQRPVVSATFAPLQAATVAPTLLAGPGVQTTVPPTATPTVLATATTTPQPVATRTPTVAETWDVVSGELGDTWDSDWPATIDRIRGFLNRFPDYPPAKEKMYAALVSYGQALIASDQAVAGAKQLEDAQDLLPTRGEASAALQALTPSPTPTRVPTPVVVVPAPTRRPTPPQEPTLVPTKVPFRP